MRICWTATKLSCEEHQNSLMCGLSGENSQPYLILTRLLEHTNDVEDWGVHFEYDDQINAGYNIVGRCLLANTLLTIDFQKRLKTMPEVDGLDVELAIEKPSLETLRAVLSRIFHGDAGIFATA